MHTRLKALFQRYADQHLHLEIAGFPLHPGASDQGPAGYVDRICVEGTRVRVIGWSLADTVALRWQGGQDSRAPHIPREDVAAVHNTTLYTGFELDGPLQGGPFELEAHMQGLVVTRTLPVLEPRRLGRTRGLLALRFVRDVLRCTPALARYMRNKDPVERAAIKRILGLHASPIAGPLVPALFGTDPAVPVAVPSATLVIPVYNAFEVTQQALSRVARNTDTPWRAILIEDCSTDSRVRPWLRDWAAAQNTAHPGRVELLENSENLGFIGSVNKGLARARRLEDPVVLLNSDALVPPGWLQRLIRPLLRDADVASVTPMSNDAEILSVPLICTRETLREGEAQALDALAQTFHPEALLADLPTGVGFCMALSKPWLDRVPLFDPAFGRGYGEEVDWCQKVRAAGGRHVGLPGLFVEHRGGESFGADDKLRLVQANNRLIANRYPGYDQEVQDFIRADPLVTARLALAIGLVAARAGATPVPVALAHALGGGAENYLQQRLRQDAERLGGAVVIRVGGPRRWQVELLTPRGNVSGGTDDFALLETLLTPLRSRHILYSCGVGDSDPVALPEALLALRRGPQDLIEVLFHDYFPLSPSYCLLDQHGVYRGVPTPEQAGRAHIHQRPDGGLVDLADWRTAWGGLLNAADTLVVFSQDSRRLVAETYPGVADKIVVRPHRLLSDVPQIAPPSAGTPLTIGVLGNIGYQKGAAVVQDLAKRLEKSGAARLVLVGNIDPAFILPETTVVCGTYRVSELDQIAARHGITCWLIPSIWPETFSYTTHEALATGLPVWGFDLGAQGAALVRADNGRVLPFEPEGDLAAIILEGLGAEAPMFRYGRSAP